MAIQQQALPNPALPPKTQGRKTPKPQPTHCLNCGAAATGKFCAECGQEIKDHSVALGPLLSEGLTELASWDSKLFRTLIPLVIRPGFLTNEYNAGRRVPFLSPLKLYLTVSVLFFLLMGWHAASKNNIHVDIGSASSQQGIHTAAEYEARQAALPPGQRDNSFKRMMKRHAYKVQQSPQAFVSALVGDIPKMMFFLLPLFAAALKLLYLRRKRLYVEHLIFLLHVHAFAFILLSPLLFFKPSWLTTGVTLALLAYIVRAMRVVYTQGWPKTLVKFSLLSLGYAVLLSVCLVGTAMAALWMF